MTIRLMVFVLCLAVTGAAYCKPADKTPPDIQAQIDACLTHAGKNDWKAVRSDYNKINWLRVSCPLPVLKELSDQLKRNASVEDIRKEIKTKYNLLKGKNESGLADEIEAVQIPVVDIQWVYIQSIYFKTVIFEMVSSPMVSLPMFRQILGLVDLWHGRYAREKDYFYNNGKRIVPMQGTALWVEREAVKQKIREGADYETLWNEYLGRFDKTMGRRTGLKRGGQ
jgi:hypothetical protein